MKNTSRYILTIAGTGAALVGIAFGANAVMSDSADGAQPIGQPVTVSDSTESAAPIPVPSAAVSDDLGAVGDDLDVSNDDSSATRDDHSDTVKQPEAVAPDVRDLDDDGDDDSYDDDADGDGQGHDDRSYVDDMGGVQLEDHADQEDDNHDSADQEDDDRDSADHEDGDKSESE